MVKKFSNFDIVNIKYRHCSKICKILYKITHIIYSYLKFCIISN